MAVGKFITFEGGEGAGKSTQTKILSKRVKDAGFKTVLTREPGGSPMAEDIREILLNDQHSGRSSLSEALLFYAARDDHLRTLITPALERGEWVISDRFSDSTRAYQGAAGGVDKAILETLETWVVGPQSPDLTFILDLPAETGLKRAEERRSGGEIDRFENLDLGFHKRLREGFLEIAEREPERCHVIDGGRTIDEIAQEIWEICERECVDV